MLKTSNFLDTFTTTTLVYLENYGFNYCMYLVLDFCASIHFKIYFFCRQNPNPESNPTNVQGLPNEGPSDKRSGKRTFEE